MENARRGFYPSPRLVVAGLALGLTALVLAAGGRAADPAQGAVDPASPTTSWQGETYSVTNLSGPEDCPQDDPNDQTCDHFTLTVNVDAAYWVAQDGGVRVRIEWPNPADDF